MSNENDIKPEGVETTRPKIVLLVGHKESAQGACSLNGQVCEWAYNMKLVDAVIEVYDGACELVKVLRRKDIATEVADINTLDPLFAVAFHANADGDPTGGRATGSEVLHYHKSRKGKALAEDLLRCILRGLGLKNRGAKAVSSEDRGGFFLRYTRCPAVVLEPFFVDNWKDLATANVRMPELAMQIAAGLKVIEESFLKKTPPYGA